jgi:hypothetical protein
MIYTKSQKRPKAAIIGPIKAVSSNNRGVIPASRKLATRKSNTNTLLPVNAWQLAGAKCQQATVAQDEFKKPVYESKFTKLTAEMNLVNFKPVPSAPEKYHARHSGW